MYNSKIIHIVEERLYQYLFIEKNIEEIKEKYNKNERDINSWIKSKGLNSKSVEIMAIKNIMMQKELDTLLLWQEVIKTAIDTYKRNGELEKVNYIWYRYFQKCSTTKIEIQMAICRATQSRIKNDIVYYIGILALKKNLLKVEDFE